MKPSIVSSVLLNAYTAFVVVVSADLCGQWDTVAASNYIIANNLWGMSEATSGQQCTGLDYADGTTVSWHTSWSWSGDSKKVKSFANANLVFTPKKVSSISSITVSVSYSYSGISGAIANVAYDLFTASTAGNKVPEFEVMIWLAAHGGAGPISSTSDPVTTTAIAGQQWKLYDGWNGNMHVYSFVAVNSPLTSFAGDIKPFFTYLAQNNGFPTSQYLNTLQIGTEPFTGSNAKLTVSAFSAAVV